MNVWSNIPYNYILISLKETEIQTLGFTDRPIIIGRLNESIFYLILPGPRMQELAPLPLNKSFPLFSEGVCFLSVIVC